jgi:hypothetical protein
MHIVEQTPNRLIIKRDRGISAIFGGSGQLVFDGDRRKIFADNKVAAWFDDIQAIDIRIHKLGDNDNQFSREVLWKVSLHFGFLKNLSIGQTFDQAFASEIAAQISKISGKKVIVWT